MITEVYDVRALDSEAKNNIQTAAQVIRNGGLVVFPTETVYGLGGDATSAASAKKIYAAKGRPSDNPLIIHIAAPEDAGTYAETSPVFDRLAARFMPGPLTVIMKSKPIIPPETRGGLDTVAVRCPSDPVAHELILRAGVPIAAPSANLSGSPSPTTCRHVCDDMMGRVDIILDGGDAAFGLESTIVKLDDDGGLTLLRPGKITLEDLRTVVTDVRVADAVTEKLREGEVALSPGMKYRHYAPKAPVLLLDGSPEKCAQYIGRQGKAHAALLCYHDDLDYFRTRFPALTVYDFGARGDEKTQAHELFYLLREADKENFDEIYAPLPSKDGIGLALYNRMIRAAAHHILVL